MKVKYIISLLSLLPALITAQFTIHNLNDSNNGYYVTEIVTTDDGVMVATRGENILCQYDGSAWIKYDYDTFGFNGDTGISAPSDLKVDGDGNYWLAYRSTIDIFDGSEVTALTASNSELQSDNVRALAFDAEGTGFFAYMNSSGISIRRDGVWTHDNEHQADLAPLNNIFRASLVEYDTVNDLIWIYDGGDLYKVTGESATVYTWADGLPSLSSDDITAMAVTTDGKVWFSINDNSFENGGLLTFDGVSWEHITSANSDLPDDDISVIATDGNNIFVGGVASKQISYYDGSQWTTYTEENSNYPDIGLNYYYDMAVWENRLYVGTSGGVVEMDLSMITSTTKEYPQSKLTMGPNPVIDLLTISSKVAVTKMEVFNYLGQKMGSQFDSQPIDFSVLPSGIYLVKVTFIDGKTEVHEVVKP